MASTQVAFQQLDALARCVFALCCPSNLSISGSCTNFNSISKTICSTLNKDDSISFTPAAQCASKNATLVGLANYVSRKLDAASLGAVLVAIVEV
jgi:hypothetical protein